MYIMVLQFGLTVVLFHTFSVSIAVLTTSIPFQDGHVKKYGDDCEAMEYCHGELVSCNNGICSCNSDMVYDEASQGCVVLAGNKCEINPDIWKISVNCIEGAICGDNGICVCTDGFYTSSSGTCIKKKFYKDNCTTDNECDSTTCIDGICSCDKRGTIYEDERCVSTVDSECEVEDEDFECTSNAVCRQGRCQCKPGYAKSMSAKCHLGFGAECNSTSGGVCADIYFMCINGHCQCKHPLHQLYDERTQECLSLVSGPCTFPRKDIKKNVTGIYDIQKCIKNAHCVDKGFYSACECKPGFVEGKSGTCSPGRGESCDQDECDPTTPLYCRNGVCDCYDLLQYYDPAIKQCVGVVGSRCTTQKPNCVEFASCVIPDTEIAGQCICDKYSVEITNRTCVYSG